MANFSVTVSGDVYTLQVIALACDEVKELVEDNIDDLEAAYEEIRDTADDNDCLHDFNFLKEGEDRAIKVEDEDGNELEGDPDNYIQIKSLMPREEYKWGDDEDYQNEEVANYDKLKALKPDADYCSGYLTNAIKKAVKGTKKNLVENLVLECMKEYDEGTQFLLVYGGSTEYCYYQMDIEDDDNDEVDAYAISLPGVESTFHVGNIDFFDESLADHVIYNGIVYGAADFEGNNYVSHPQFQLVDGGLNPIDTPASEGGTVAYCATHEGISSSSMKYLQIIGVDEHIDELLKQNAGHIEKVYEEIAEYAEEANLMNDIRFFTREDEIEQQVTDDDGEKCYVETWSKSIHPEKDEDDEESYLSEVEDLKAIEFADYCSPMVIEAFKKAIGNDDMCFIKDMIKEGMPKRCKNYLLVLGDDNGGNSPYGSSHFEVYFDEESGEFDYDELNYIGVDEKVEIGSLKFKVAIIADHIIYRQKMYGPYSDDADSVRMTVVDIPQFQLVDGGLNPIGAEE